MHIWNFICVTHSFIKYLVNVNLDMKRLLLKKKWKQTFNVKQNKENANKLKQGLYKICYLFDMKKS